MTAVRLTLGVALASMVAVACTPMHSRLQPYRDCPAAEAVLARRARTICSCLRADQRLPPHAFTTDGCSMSPDGDWSDCCVDHDIAYWCGGSRDDRREADRRLASCVVARGHSHGFGECVRLAVRAGGVPWKPFPWRWAYGWEGLRGYEHTPQGRDAGACFMTP